MAERLGKTRGVGGAAVVGEVMSVGERGEVRDFDGGMLVFVWRWKRVRDMVRG